MKKVYSKPDIAFEDFTVSTSVAAGCENATNTPSSGTCGLEFGSYTIFLDTVSACTGEGVIQSSGGDGEYNGYCYHVFADNGPGNIFNS